MAATLFVGVSELVMPHLQEGATREPLDVVPDAALLVDGGKIRAAGPRAEVLPRAQGAICVDLEGRAVLPGLVDSHTHVVFAGDRVDELWRRARGETYETIARAGGGIARSAALLAAASVDDLVRESLPRVRTMVARGTTTLEVKSGYGLVPEQEHKHLAAIARLAEVAPASVLATVLAHVIPAAERHDRAAFVTRFIREVLEPAAARGDVTFADVFVETGAFTADEARLIAARVRELGLRLKLHVDQLREGGGAELAVDLGALSADHLEHTSPPGRVALAKAGTIATILPGCRFFLGHGPWPDGRALREAGCEVAVATDCNPGTSMVTDLGLCATLAATQCGLTLDEALWAVTRGGARALGLDDRGTLRAGERADFVVVDHADWRAIFYTPGSPPVHSVRVAGRQVGPASPR